MMRAPTLRCRVLCRRALATSALASRHRPTAMMFRDLLDIGLDAKRLSEHGMFLRRELQARFLQSVRELESLPVGLVERAGIRRLRWRYTTIVRELNSCTPPIAEGTESTDFMNLLERTINEDSNAVESLTLSVWEAMRELGNNYIEIQPEVDSAMERFLMSRVGQRFLLKHYLDSHRNAVGFSGNIQLDCNPVEMAKSAADRSTALCMSQYGCTPQIVVHDTTARTCTYAPLHIQYILTEVFKNALRSVVEKYGEDSQAMPAVHCEVLGGEQDVTFKVSDCGGGIPDAKMADIWKFAVSTCSSSPLQRRGSSVLAGYGIGLPLSRIHSRYFGGDLNVSSQEGVGSDVYLKLSRQSTQVENLPEAPTPCVASACSPFSMATLNACSWGLFPNEPTRMMAI